MRKLGFESLSRSRRFRPATQRQWFMSIDRSIEVRKGVRRDTRSEVARLLDDGLSRAPIAGLLDISPGNRELPRAAPRSAGIASMRAALRLDGGTGVLRRGPQHL